MGTTIQTIISDIQFIRIDSEYLIFKVNKEEFIELFKDCILKFEKCNNEYQAITFEYIDGPGFHIKYTIVKMNNDLTSKKRKILALHTR